MAEIGLRTGVTTRYILRRCPTIKRYHAVDPYAVVSGGDSYYDDWPFEALERKFRQRTAKWLKSKVLKLHKTTSLNAAKQIKECSLDLVFIDGDHSYEGCKADIQAWLPKVRSGGVFSGHDTHFPGVKQAIDEELKGWQEWKPDHVWFIQV